MSSPLSSADFLSAVGQDAKTKEQKTKHQNDAKVIMIGEDDTSSESQQENTKEDNVLDITGKQELFTPQPKPEGKKDIPIENVPIQSPVNNLDKSESTVEENGPQYSDEMPVNDLIAVVASEMNGDDKNQAEKDREEWTKALLGNRYDRIGLLREMERDDWIELNIPLRARNIILKKMEKNLASSSGDVYRRGKCEGEQRYDKYGFRPEKARDGSRKLPVFHDPPEHVLAKRAQKWHKMLSNWPKWMSSSSKRAKIKERVRKGIPESMRGQAWQTMSGSILSMKNNPGVYEECQSKEPDKADLDIIMRDLDRTYPTHISFEDPDGRGQQEMRVILKAFAVYRPNIGYVQGMGMLVGMMLMHMPEENAFWLLVTIMDKYLPGMFDKMLSQFHIDCAIFDALLPRKLKKVAQHLEELGVPSEMFGTKWFLCVYTITLPWELALAVWDIFMFEGVQIVFTVGIALCMLCEKEVLRQVDAGEIVDLFNHIPPEKFVPDDFRKLLFSVKLTRKELVKEHYIQLEKWKEHEKG